MTFTLRATDVPDEKSRNGIVGPLVAYNESQTSRSDYLPLIIATAVNSQPPRTQLSLGATR